MFRDGYVAFPKKTKVSDEIILSSPVVPFVTGFPIVVRFGAEPKPLFLLHSGSKDGVPVPIVRKGADAHAELLISVPGSYELRHGASTLAFTVGPQQNISFAFEIGAVMVAVSLTLMGIFIWFRKIRSVRTKNEL